MHLCLRLALARFGAWFYLLHEATLHLSCALGHCVGSMFPTSWKYCRNYPKKLVLSLSGGG